jgi:hypothetical protein
VIAAQRPQRTSVLRFELATADPGLGWQAAATLAGMNAGRSKLGNRWGHLLGQVGVGRSAALGTVG